MECTLVLPCQNLPAIEKNIYAYVLCIFLYTTIYLSLGTRQQLVCLFWIFNRICTTGSTPKGGPMEICPTTQATRHPPPPPPPPPGLVAQHFCHASYIRSVPSPVLLSCTYNPSSIWSVPSLSSCNSI